MAATTFANRIALSLRLLIPEQRIINMSRGPGPGTTELTTRTAEMANVAANVYEARMGSAGAYDDASSTIGNQQALAWGVRYAKHLFMDAFQPDPDPSAEATETRLMQELEMYRATGVAEAAVPVVVDSDGEVIE